jgi:hypothetical protein
MLKRLATIVLCASLSACIGKDDMIKDRTLIRIQKFEQENPDKPLTVELYQQFKAEAEAEVEAEIKLERQKALEALPQAAGAAATGNWILLAFLVLGAGGTAIGVNRHLKADKTPISAASQAVIAAAEKKEA